MDTPAGPQFARSPVPKATRRAAFIALLAATTPTPAYDIGEGLSLSGLLEVEAGFESNSEDTSDITAATAELHLNSRISDRVSSHIQLLWEENETDPIDMDEATLTLYITEAWSLTAGKRYVPFGRFDTHMISDPLTLELGETTESVVQAGFDQGRVAGSVYAFRSKTQDAGEDPQIRGYGANIGYVADIGIGSIDLGASYISNLGDSNGLRELGTVIDRQVPGVGLFAAYNNWPFWLLAEHIMATDQFRAGDYDGLLTAEAEPTASNLEASYELPNGLLVALGYQQTDDADFLLPEREKGYLATISKEVLEGARLGIEYSAFDHYDGSDSQQIVLQLASEF